MREPVCRACKANVATFDNKWCAPCWADRAPEPAPTSLPRGRWAIRPATYTRNDGSIAMRPGTARDRALVTRRARATS